MAQWFSVAILHQDPFLKLLSAAHLSNIAQMSCSLSQMDCARGLHWDSPTRDQSEAEVAENEAQMILK